MLHIAPRFLRLLRSAWPALLFSKFEGEKFKATVRQVMMMNLSWLAKTLLFEPFSIEIWNFMLTKFKWFTNFKKMISSTAYASVIRFSKC
jgi:hypothetical protein